MCVHLCVYVLKPKCKSYILQALEFSIASIVRLVFQYHYIFRKHHLSHIVIRLSVAPSLARN